MAHPLIGSITVACGFVFLFYFCFCTTLLSHTGLFQESPALVLGWQGPVPPLEKEALNLSCILHVNEVPHFLVKGFP
jgi:hypothetical protein